MNFLRLAVAVVLTFCSTAIMSYIAMATPIGPWIETTVVLAAMLIFSLFIRRMTSFEYSESLGLTTAAAGIGGILATGVGFSFPTLYFIDQATFKVWMANPLYFVSALGALAFAAGSCGLAIAHIFEPKFIVKEQLPFPIGELIYKMISVERQLGRALLLALGFVGTTLFLLIQRYISFIPQAIKIIPREIALGYGITIPALTFSVELMPMFWAIGFITGHVIALPLLIGLVAKLFCIDPLQYYYPSLVAFLWSSPVQPITSSDFTTAFCSGIVLYSAASSSIELPKALYRGIKKVFSHSWIPERSETFFNDLPWVQAGIAVGSSFAVLWYFNFSFFAQVYLLVGTFICAYQLMYIAGKIGLAPLGRFATFVLVPGLFLFTLNGVQSTIIATFVEIAGGVACDVLFGRKMAYLAGIERRRIVWYQWLGLLVSALSIGAICWLLFSTFGLGNEPGALPVNRAVGRALLINCKNFDFFVLGMGILFGYLLTFTRVSPVLVLGGILMPLAYSLMLITGGLFTYLVKQKEDYYPLWSGIFASNSLWMVIKALLR
jgi:hypothetical protein